MNRPSTLSLSTERSRALRAARRRRRAIAHDVATYNTPAERSELLDMAKRAEAGGHRADAAVLQDLLLP
ncbi:hypothetical protein ABLG96_04960 [Nakamurella sp. A5-74]|uniref:Uncharacterized protein n=1 Tax=Nakamurella sp. A5-74 TaxID=3158264 RepID=A0AAU8DR40_9ACTN